MKPVSRPSMSTKVLDRFMQNARPRSAIVEATSHRQLRCPSCPTAQRDTDKALGRGYLTPAMLTRILDTGQTLRHLELSNWGEAFLNPKLEDILKIARARRIDVKLSNGVISTMSRTRFWKRWSSMKSRTSPARSTAHPRILMSRIGAAAISIE